MKPDFNTVTEFENKIAEFFGAPYAVATDSCTHAIELCLRYVKAKYISCVRNTYLSIPMLAKKLDIPLFWQEKGTNWVDYYKVHSNIYDAAVLWRRDSYISGSMMCVSMQYQKHLSIGRLGVILVDSKEKWLKLKKMSYDGRLPGIPWRNQNIDTFGFHYYAQPELCQLALDKLPDAIETEPRKWVYTDWNDLTNMTVFKNKYQKIYNQIIDKARLEKRVKSKKVYYEKHHIIPRCLGGSNDRDNLILLTAREHFLMHKLLCLIYPDEPKFKFALWKMVKQKNSHQQRAYSLSSREYEYVRKEVSRAMSITSKLRWSDKEYVERMKKAHQESNIKNPQRRIQRSIKGKERYKDPEERRKTGESIRRALANNPESVKKRALLCKKKFKEHPELIANSRHVGKENGKWLGYCYVFNPDNELVFKFETKHQARQTLKCAVITNNYIPKRGKWKGFKFVISKETLI